MVVVQIRPFNLKKTIFKKIKIKQLNYLISYTDKRKVFLERLNKPNNTFEKFSLWEKLIITGKEMIKKNQNGAQKFKVLNPGKILFP